MVIGEPYNHWVFKSNIMFLQWQCFPYVRVTHSSVMPWGFRNLFVDRDQVFLMCMSLIHRLCREIFEIRLLIVTTFSYVYVTHSSTLLWVFLIIFFTLCGGEWSEFLRESSVLICIRHPLIFWSLQSCTGGASHPPINLACPFLRSSGRISLNV